MVRVCTETEQCLSQLPLEEAEHLNKVYGDDVTALAGRDSLNGSGAGLRRSGRSSGLEKVWARSLAELSYIGQPCPRQ